jgi:hypothetical protein
MVRGTKEKPKIYFCKYRVHNPIYDIVEEKFVGIWKNKYCVPHKNKGLQITKPGWFECEDLGFIANDQPAFNNGENDYFAIKVVKPSSRTPPNNQDGCHKTKTILTLNVEQTGQSNHWVKVVKTTNTIDSPTITIYASSGESIKTILEAMPEEYKDGFVVNVNSIEIFSRKAFLRDIVDICAGALLE